MYTKCVDCGWLAAGEVIIKENPPDYAAHTMMVR